MNDLIEQIKLWSISHKLDKTDPFTATRVKYQRLRKVAYGEIKGRKGDTDLVPLNTRKIKTWKTSNEPKDNI